MATNRYDDVSVSQFKPLSLEEVMLVPQLKRQQHNQLVAQREQMLAGLAKVDPLDKHYNEALRLKNELESKLDTFSTQLSKQGINPQMTDDMIRLNRQYQTSTGAMGPIGQINAAKQSYTKESEDYLKEATALKYSPEIVNTHLKEIQAKYNQSPIYDEKGKVVPFKVDSLPPSYLNHVDEAERFYKGMGMTSTEWQNAVSGVVQDPNTGSYVATKTGGGSSAKNTTQRQAVIDFLNNRLANPNDDLRKSLDYQRINPNQALKDIQNMSGIYAKDSTGTKSGYDISNFSGPDKDKETTISTEPVTYDTKEVGTKEQDYDEILKIGTSSYVVGQSGSGLTMGTTGSGSVTSTKPFSYTDIKNNLVKERYKATYDDLIKSGRMRKEADINSNATARAVINEMKQEGPITLSSKVIKSDMALNNLGFPGTLTNKDSKERSNSIVKDLQANTRQLVDPETNREITYNEFMDKYPNSTFSYYGYSSPHNWEDTSWGNKKQNVAPNQVVVTDKDTKQSIVTKVSRTKEELGTKDFMASETLHNTYQKVTIRPNSFVQLQTSNPRLKGIEVKYNTKTEDGVPKFQLKINGKLTPPLTEAQYIEYIYKEYNK